MGKKTKVALTVGAAGVAAWAASKAVARPQPRAEKEALQFSEIAVLADLQALHTADSTLEACRTAADLGVHGLQVSVQLTKDEEIIAVPASCLPLAGELADYTLAEMKNALHPGGGVFEQPPGVCSLRELLDAFPQLLFVISMTDSPDTYEGSLIPSKLWRLLKEAGAADRAAVTSSYDEQIDRFNLYAQDSVAIGAGNEEIKKAYVAYTSAFGHLYKPNADLFCLPEKLGVFPLVSSGFVQFLHQLNITVLFEQTASSDLAKLAKTQADGIVTAVPEQTLAYFSNN